MTAPEPWFLGYLLSDDACIRLLAVMAAGFFSFLASAAMRLSFLSRCDEKLDSLYELSMPVATLRYSPNGELRAWDGRAEFWRGDACVGIVRSGAVRLDWHGDKLERIAEVSYLDGPAEKFCCGPMGWQEARKAGSIVMRCAGRHGYG